MAYQDNKGQELKRWYYWICPKCKSKVHLDRRYCSCGMDLNHQTLYYSESAEKPKMLDRVCLDVPFHACEDCYSCDYCASFSANMKNSSGFGGLDCEHKSDSIRCRCCGIQIKAFMENSVPTAAVQAGLDQIKLIRQQNGKP